MTVVNIMPQAVNETVRGFEGVGRPTASEVGEVALATNVRACVDELYTSHDRAMQKLLSKLAGVE